MKVNGIEIRTNGYFVWDGCHKIYVCETDADIDTARKFGYDEFFPIALLPEVYRNSCPLRFIEGMDLKTTYCRQFEEATFDED